MTVSVRQRGALFRSAGGVLAAVRCRLFARRHMRWAQRIERCVILVDETAIMARTALTIMAARQAAGLQED